jgi:colanic acid/amylovoran biosynthesis protein
VSAAFEAVGRRRRVLLTFATVSWQKGSAAQVTSLVSELRKRRGDLSFALLSHCPERDGGPARELGIEVVGPVFPARAGRDRRSVSLLARRLASAAASGLGRTLAGRPAVLPEPAARAYAAAEYVLDLSGDSYRDRPGGFAAAHHANLLAARAARVPYALASQSLGPFHPLNRAAARRLLAGADLLWIRESITRRILVQLGVPSSRVELAPDVAFALEPLPPDPIWQREALEHLPAERPWLAISVSHLAQRLSTRESGGRYLEGLARLCAHLRRRYGGTLFLVPHEVAPPGFRADDRTAGEALAERLGRPPWMRPIVGDYAPGVLKGFIARCDALVASRMHAGIAGLSSGVPTILISWSHKYRGLAGEIGLEGSVWDPNADGAERLIEMFDRMWERREAVTRRLLDYTLEARRRIAEATGRLAARIPGPERRDAAHAPRAEAS